MRRCFTHQRNVASSGADPGWSVRGGGAQRPKLVQKGLILQDFGKFQRGQCPHAPLLDPPLQFQYYLASFHFSSLIQTPIMLSLPTLFFSRIGSLSVMLDWVDFSFLWLRSVFQLRINVCEKHCYFFQRNVTCSAEHREHVAATSSSFTRNQQCRLILSYTIRAFLSRKCGTPFQLLRFTLDE